MIQYLYLKERNYIMYNLIDEPWIHVKYLNGTEKYLGLKELFKDAHFIDDVIIDSFRDEKFAKYEFCLYRLLSVITMDAYSQIEEYDVDTRTDLLHAGHFSNVIFDYLDKYYDRFDLFDSNHPFLQIPNKRFKDFKGIKTSNNNSVQNLSPTAIAASGRIFGKKVELIKNPSEYYKPSPAEFAFLLLYSATCRAASGCSGNSGLLGAQCSIHFLIKRNSLFEHIILNTEDTKKSSDNIPAYRCETTDEVLLKIKQNKIKSLKRLSGALLVPLYVYGELDNDGLVNVSTANNPNWDKALRTSLKLQWLSQCEWNSLITNSDNKELPYRLTTIRSYTPLWFDLFEYETVGGEKGKDHLFAQKPKIFKNLPDDIDYNVEFFVSAMAEKNSAFLYCSKKTNKNMSKVTRLNPKEDKILVAFIQDYLDTISALNYGLMSFGARVLKTDEKDLIVKFVSPYQNIMHKKLSAAYSDITMLVDFIHSDPEFTKNARQSLINNALNVFDDINVQPKYLSHFANAKYQMKTTLYTKFK